MLTGALDGGGTMSLRSDHLGKVMYAWLLRMEINGVSRPVRRSSPPGAARWPSLTLNRPDDRNPLDRAMSAALLAAFAAMADPEVRGVAIAAVGPAFCAGGDLRQMKDLAGCPPSRPSWP